MNYLSEKMLKRYGKRHKCNACGAVRFECFMKRLDPQETQNWDYSRSGRGWLSSYFGNDRKCWICVGGCYRSKKP